jgi:DNA-binding MarR family transcriptional regulator
MHRILLTLCAGGQNLGRLRLSLGMSRSAVTRRVFELLRAKLVEVEGAPEVVVDPVTDMLEKGAVLVREGQYDAAELVCSSLLASDPAERRVREFARMVQSEHVAALYAQLPPLAVPMLVHDPRRSRCSSPRSGR